MQKQPQSKHRLPLAHKPARLRPAKIRRRSPAASSPPSHKSNHCASEPFGAGTILDRRWSQLL
jgi:hypothetical protein